MEVLHEKALHVMETIVSLPTVTLISIALILLTLYYWPVWRRYKYPPGPIPLPFFGDIPLAVKNSKNLGRYFHENRHKYGDVFTMQFQVPTVVLNSPEAIHEGFVKNGSTLSTRPTGTVESPLQALGFHKAHGVIDGFDGDWQLLRRHLLTVFKDKGVGKKGMEEVIQEEIKYFLEVLERTQSESIDTADQLIQSISNVATHIVFGKRFDYNAEQLNNLQFTEYFGKYRQTQIAPFVRNLPLDPSGFQKAGKKVLKAIKFSQDQIDEHKRDIDTENPRDFIDSFLVEAEKAKNTDTPFTNDNLIAVVMQIYVAGTDTTSTSLYWAFLYMILYPDVQKKIYTEICEVIGERTPTSADRLEMPYTMSTVTEILRTDIATAALPHYTKADTVVCGHTIPKGTTVIGNLWSATHNETYFDEPNKFKADRFLDSDGNFVKPDVKYFNPFSVGRRMCPGEQLARSEIFLFLVSTLQKYSIESGQDTRPSDDGTVDFTLFPPNYKTKFVPRV